MKEWYLITEGLMEEVAFCAQECMGILPGCGRGGREYRLVYEKEGNGVAFDGRTVTIRGNLPRGILLFAGRIWEEPFVASYEDTTLSLGFWFDFAKNVTYNDSAIKRQLVLLAMMGYQKVYWGMSDGMKLKGEEFFGHLRYQFTPEYLKSVDTYARRLGLMLIPAIPTLTGFGHLFRQQQYWPRFFDCDDILLAGDEHVFALLESMMEFCRESFSGNKIHIGMDYTGGYFGRWSYYRKNGFRAPDVILTDHINAVAALAREKGFEEVELFSDFLFEVSLPDEEKGTAYDKDYTEEREYDPLWTDPLHLTGSTRKKYQAKKLTDYIIAHLDVNASLCATVIAEKGKKEFDQVFARHRRVKNDLQYMMPVKCGNFTPHNKYYMEKARHLLAVCRKYSVSQFTVMFLNDNGGECSLFSHLPLLFEVAESVWGMWGRDYRFRALTGIEERAFLALDLPDCCFEPGSRLIAPSEYGLYNDILLGIFDRHIRREDEKRYADYGRRLEELASHAGDYAENFRMLASLCRVLMYKYALGIKVRECYQKQDREGLRRLLQQELAMLPEAVQEFGRRFRELWEQEKLPYSFETQLLHIGGLYQRIIDAKKRIESYLEEAVRIDELEEEIQNAVCGDYPDGEPVWESNWCRMCTVNRI